MKDKLLNMIAEINPLEEIEEGTLLIEEGILDSLTLVFLIGEIETEFGITIPEDKLKPEEFGSIELIENMIMSLIK